MEAAWPPSSLRWLTSRVYGPKSLLIQPRYLHITGQLAPKPLWFLNHSWSTVNLETLDMKAWGPHSAVDCSPVLNQFEMQDKFTWNLLAPNKSFNKVGATVIRAGNLMNNTFHLTFKGVCIVSRQYSHAKRVKTISGPYINIKLGDKQFNQGCVVAPRTPLGPCLIWTSREWGQTIGS